MKSYRLLATLAAISGCLLALPAKAGLITVSGSVSNPGGSQSYGPVSDGGFISDGVMINEWNYSEDIEGYWRGNASSWGNESGAYGAEVSANSGTATAKYHRLITINNNSTGAADYSLEFLVYGSSLSATHLDFSGYDHGSIQDYYLSLVDPEGYAKASYSLSISRGATTLFTSMVELDSKGVLNTDGMLLGGTLSHLPDMRATIYSYDWDDTLLNLYLGELGSGESMDIHIDLIVSAFSNTGVCHNPVELICTGARVGFSDPGEISETTQPPLPITITSGPASNNNNVPEPGTLSLLALGLTGFALRARRNRRRD